MVASYVRSFVSRISLERKLVIGSGFTFIGVNALSCDKSILKSFQDGDDIASDHLPCYAEDGIDCYMVDLATSLRKYITLKNKSTSEMKKNEAKFPTLQVKLWNNDTSEPFIINSNEAIPINNNLFTGHVKLVVKPSKHEHDPNYKKRICNDEDTFFFQIQGKLKKPMHQLFVGAQLNDSMPSSKIMNKLSRLILNCLGKALGQGMSYSFGNEHERPHISFPLHTAMESIIISRDGQAVPILGSSFANAEVLDSQRISSNNEQYWDTDVTYSIQFTASSIDLSTWKIIYPFEINLERFWGDSPVCLVIFEKDETSGCNDRQESDKSYLFNLQIKHLDEVSIHSIDETASQIPPNVLWKK